MNRVRRRHHAVLMAGVVMMASMTTVFGAEAGAAAADVAYAYGFNDFGQLGNITERSAPTTNPVAVVDLATNVAHRCAECRACRARKVGSGYTACEYSLMRPPRTGRRRIVVVVACRRGSGLGDRRRRPQCGRWELPWVTYSASTVFKWRSLTMSIRSVYSRPTVPTPAFGVCIRSGCLWRGADHVDSGRSPPRLRGPGVVQGWPGGSTFRSPLTTPEPLRLMRRERSARASGRVRVSGHGPVPGSSALVLRGWSSSSFRRGRLVPAATNDPRRRST